jgi:dolichyl-phosphate-mannose-protein mannosyltransferase
MRGSKAGVLAPPAPGRGEARPRYAHDDEQSRDGAVSGAVGDGEPADLQAETRPLSRGVVALVIATVVFGVALRAWFLFHTTIDSDQAIVGLMGHDYLHGHLTAFYWGQQYGGVEGFTAAALFRLAGESALSLCSAAVLLSAVGATLVWRITRRVVSDPNLAILAGGLAWAAPLAFVFKSTREYGLRGVTLVCGLGLVLFALRILDDEIGLREFVALGLLTGLGWWSLPEIVYFVLPGAFLVVGAIARSARGLRFWAARLGVAMLAGLVGALPWLWANVNSGFASIKPSRFPGTSSPLNPGYAGRLGVIFRKALPTELGLRPSSLGFGQDATNRWVLDRSASLTHALLVLLLAGVAVCIVAAVVLCVVRGGRALAMVAALVMFPFLAAAQPGTWYWQDGRYLVYFGPLLAIVLAIGCDEAARLRESVGNRDLSGRRTRFGRLAFVTIVVAAVSVTALAFHVATRVGPSNFLADWGRADHGAESVATSLQKQGVRYAYADYWVAYKLDFLSHEHLVVTVGASETDRSQTIDEAVRRADTAAWLFVPVSHLPAGYQMFGATDLIRGPDGVSELAFREQLDRMHVGYRIVHAGPIDAVIPERQIAPENVVRAVNAESTVGPHAASPVDLSGRT